MAEIWGDGAENPDDTLDAEKPKPLKPLTKEAKSITQQKNKKSFSDKSIVVKYSILSILEYFCYKKLY